MTGTQALIDKAEKEKGGMINMCQAVDEALQEREARGRINGLQEGEIKGKLEMIINNLQKVMKRFQVDLDEAMDILEIPANEREIYKEKYFS